MNGITLSALSFDTSGEGRSVTLDAFAEGENISRLLAQERCVWVHVVVNDRLVGEKFLLGQGFHPVAVNDALTVGERPVMREFPGVAFLVVPVVEMLEEEEIFHELSIFLTENMILTVSLFPLDCIESASRRLCEAFSRVDARPAFLLYFLADHIVDAYFPSLDRIEEAIDCLSDITEYAGDRQMHAIRKEKRRLLEMRRKIYPLRDVLNALLRRNSSLIPANLDIYFRDVYEDTMRISESIELNREILTGLLDIHLSSVSNNLNVVMKKMTIISTVLMTSTLVAGIYGMNFKAMPELAWPYGYPMAISLMVLSGLTILGLFRWKKWI